MKFVLCCLYTTYDDIVRCDMTKHQRTYHTTILAFQLSARACYDERARARAPIPGISCVYASNCPREKKMLGLITICLIVVHMCLCVQMHFTALHMYNHLTYFDLPLTYFDPKFALIVCIS